MEQGTITWFKCEDTLPPMSDEIDKTSSYILLCAPGFNPVTGKYHFDTKYWLHQNHWHPTHWAYINYPKE